MKKRSLAAVVLGLLASCATACNGAPVDEAVDTTEAPLSKLPAGAVTIDPARELVITDLSVVEDPVRTVYPAGGRGGSSTAGAWTFGALVEQMAGSTDPDVVSSFVQHWLTEWTVDQQVNGFTAPARATIQSTLLDPWLAKSGGQRLDMQFAPFRLLAITNRMDLRNSTLAKHDPSFNAGEGRFVFGALNATGGKLFFTVIFEYGLTVDVNKKQHTNKGQDIQAWAQAWHGLGTTPFGPRYNTALQAITDRFAGPNCPWQPNPTASCINQVRTNEVALGTVGSDPANIVGGRKLWELREFHLSTMGVLEEARMNQTPDASFRGSPALASMINANEQALLDGTFMVPPSALAASDAAPFGGVWNAPGIVSEEARFKLASNTCSGCHTGETGTSFLHIKPRAAGQASQLSGFLTGKTVTDPVSGVTRTFNDLAARSSNMVFMLTSGPHDLEGQKQNNRAD